MKKQIGSIFAWNKILFLFHQVKITNLYNTARVLFRLLNNKSLLVSLYIKTYISVVIISKTLNLRMLYVLMKLEI